MPALDDWIEVLPVDKVGASPEPHSTVTRPAVRRGLTDRGPPTWYARTIRNQANHMRIDPREITLPGALKAAGYETALIGKNHAFLEGENYYPDAADDGHFRQLRAIHYGMIRQDDNLARFFAALDEAGLSQNTVVVLYSDTAVASVRSELVEKLVRWQIAKGDTIPANPTVAARMHYRPVPKY